MINENQPRLLVSPSLMIQTHVISFKLIWKEYTFIIRVVILNVFNGSKTADFMVVHEPDVCGQLDKNAQNCQTLDQAWVSFLKSVL